MLSIPWGKKVLWRRSFDKHGTPNLNTCEKAGHHCSIYQSSTKKYMAEGNVYEMFALVLNFVWF
jgi:hypothetical protein